MFHVEKIANIDNIQKAAIVYTMTHARHLLVPSKDQSRVTQLAEYLLNFLAEGMVNLSLRKQAASALEYVVLGDKDNTVRNILYTNFIPTLQQHTSSKGDPVFIGLYLQVLLGSAQHMTQELVLFIQGSFRVYAAYSIKLFNSWPEIAAHQNRESMLEKYI